MLKQTKERAVNRFFRYPKIFWDDPEIASATPSELMRMLEEWRMSDDHSDKLRLNAFIRRMIERGSISDAQIFLKPEEARRFFETETAWFIDRRLDSLWLRFSGLPESFPLKRKLDGRQKSRESCW